MVSKETVMAEVMRSAQNQVNVGRDILYLDKVEETHGHLSNINKSQEPWINQQKWQLFFELPNNGVLRVELCCDSG